MKVISIIESKYDSLTNGEKKVADYYIVCGNNIVEKTLADISEDVGVGEATIVRFCKKIGFLSFQDVRLQINIESVDRVDIKRQSFITQIESNITNTISRTIEILELNNVNAAIKLINETNKLLCYGVGDSGLAAEIIARRFVRVGKKCQGISDPHFQAMYSVSANESDLILAFSRTGRSKDLIHAVCIAKKNGSKVIAITNFKKSPLAKMADIILLTSMLSTPLTGGNLVGEINQIFIGDVLTTGYSLLNEDRTLEMNKKTFQAIQEKMVD